MLVDNKQDPALKKLLDQRNKTSLKGFVKLSKVNRVLFQTMKLLKIASKNELNDKANNIIDSFIKNESEFFVE